MKQGFISINDNIFPTLLALSETEQTRGLMGKTWPPPIMSFVYSYPRVNKFWMSNTPSPLDIVFCNNNVVTQICKGVPYSTEIIGNNTFSDLVIEYPLGTVAQSNIQIGNIASLFMPSLEEIRKYLIR